MQLFHAESSDRYEKPFPRATQFVSALVLAYVLLSIACGVAYRLAGMTRFDAVIHAMTTLSTGGYSTSDQSLAHFPRPFVHWTAIVFMLAGGLPVIPLAHALAGGVRNLFANSQIRAILGFLAVIIATMTLWLWVSNDVPLADALRFAAFNVVSVVTTTGYANADYGQWGPFALGIFFVLIFVGGCTGSTGGGIKIFRFQVITRIIGGHFRTLVTPHAVSVTLYEGRLLDDGVIRSVMIFTATFIATVVVLGLILAALGLDFMTSFSGAATAVANVGPGLGDVIGPSGNFASLPDSAKWVLSLGMLLGRLEFFTVLVILTPRFWRG
jgi:trk system potassium uptake protein TrkH